ncbi:hypothetical protein [Streptomyces halstedii]|uniref:hypothetical protein n=1 Tax=Streptomyces halstedii TaxID=1944 RepID=UPI001942A6E5|nr:hypothetical protein [Streptomyces halstedii]
MGHVGDLRRGLGLPVLVPLLLLTACSPGGGAPAENKPGVSSPATGGPAPTPSVLDADPARLPDDRESALALVRQVIATPDSFGPDAVKRTPYQSGPDTWPVLGADCVWRRAKTPDSVLATLTRSFELPAADGKGPLRLSAVVTVHRTRDDARWEMAESLEETMRCPAQRLRRDERIGSMLSGVLLSGEGGQRTSEDTLTESGEFHSTELGGPHPYEWHQAQTLQFTVAVTGKGAKGRTADELSGLSSRAVATMLTRLESAVEKRS